MSGWESTQDRPYQSGELITLKFKIDDEGPISAYTISFVPHELMPEVAGRQGMFTDLTWVSTPGFSLASDSEGWYCLDLQIPLITYSTVYFVKDFYVFNGDRGFAYTNPTLSINVQTGGGGGFDGGLVTALDLTHR